MAENRIFVGQEALQLTLDTGMDLSGASDLKIKFKKPSGVAGEWDGVLSGTTSIQKTFLADGNELDEKGTWIFWAFAIMSDGRDIPGEPVKHTVHEQGSFQ